MIAFTAPIALRSMQGICTKPTDRIAGHSEVVLHDAKAAIRGERRVVKKRPEASRLRPGLAARVDKDVRGEFEAGAEFANLIQSELARAGKKHGHGAFRAEFSD